MAATWWCSNRFNCGCATTRLRQAYARTHTHMYNIHLWRHSQFTPKFELVKQPTKIGCSLSSPPPTLFVLKVICRLCLCLYSTHTDAHIDSQMLHMYIFAISIYLVSDMDSANCIFERAKKWEHKNQWKFFINKAHCFSCHCGGVCQHIKPWLG